MYVYMSLYIEMSSLYIENSQTSTQFNDEGVRLCGYGVKKPFLNLHTFGNGCDVDSVAPLGPPDKKYWCKKPQNDPSCQHLVRYETFHNNIDFLNSISNWFEGEQYLPVDNREILMPKIDQWNRHMIGRWYKKGTICDKTRFVSLENYMQHIHFFIQTKNHHILRNLSFITDE